MKNENKNTFTLSENEKMIIAKDVEKAFTIKDYKNDGIVMDAESVIAKIEKAMNDIMHNDGKKTNILQDGNGKIDDSVLCQAIFPVFTCPCHCVGCYAVNACTKKFNGIGKQTAEAWYKWMFIEKYYPDVYFMQIDRELSKTDSDECRWHVSGDFIDNNDVNYCIDTFKKYPHIKFYTYTKRDAERDNMPSLTILENMENVNIADSLPGGMKNYGSEEYLEKLANYLWEKHGVKLHVCECGTSVEKEFNKAHSRKNGGDGQKYCGGKDGCKMCRNHKYIGFHIHK